jgi:hypothetical protein
MELIYVILADAAEVASSGKFSLLGGGIETIYAPAFPTVQPALALVVRLRDLSPEAEQEHTLRVEITGPNAFHAELGDVAKFKLLSLNSTTDGTIAINLVINLQMLIFPEPGTYLFHLFVDSQEVGTISLAAQKPMSDETSSSSDQQKL